MMAKMGFRCFCDAARNARPNDAVKEWIVAENGRERETGGTAPYAQALAGGGRATGWIWSDVHLGV